MAVRLWFHGVRGSTPAPGAPFVEVGGHTSCVSVLRADQRVPRLVLDAGTGLQALSAAIDHQPFDGTILLTHLHWDHVQGLPFFRAGDQPAARVQLRLPDQGDPLELLERAMSPPHFPIGPTGLLGEWCFEPMASGPCTIEGFTVTAGDVPHKGGRTFGYRIEAEGRAIAYVPDHRPGGDDLGLDATGRRHTDRARALCRGVDVLVHDAQFLASEQALAEAYGHSTVDEAVALARECGAGRLVLFHHGPTRTDADLRPLAAELRSAAVPVSLATQGTLVDV